MKKYFNEGIFEKVVLISNPFAMIFCYNEKNYYFFSINGELIQSEPVEKGAEFYPYIDKYFGIFKDYIEMRIKPNLNNNKIVESRNIQLSFH